MKRSTKRYRKVSECLFTVAKITINLVHLLGAAYEGGTSREFLQLAGTRVGACRAQPTQDV